MKLTPRVEMLLEALLNEAGLSVGVDPRVFSHQVGEALMTMQEQRQLKQEGDLEQKES